MHHHTSTLLLTACSLCFPLHTSGYTQDTVLAQNKDEILRYSLDELLKVKIITATKQDEPVAESQLSVSVLSREEIVNSGATSISEALRLIPGMIVREQTPGNYDIHIRGLDNTLPNSFLYDAINSISLVMIDNRVVYNYFTGGTLWETLPVGIEDIEKIEVIRGPSSVFYGPNAASGVIHIITRSEKNDDSSIVVDMQGGNHNTVLKNVYINQRVGDKTAFSLSVNDDRRERHAYEYFSFSGEEYRSAS